MREEKARCCLDAAKRGAVERFNPPPGSVVTGEVMGGLGGGDIGGTDPGSLFSSATWRARRAARGGSGGDLEPPKCREFTERDSAPEHP